MNLNIRCRATALILLSEYAREADYRLRGLVLPDISARMSFVVLAGRDGFHS